MAAAVTAGKEPNTIRQSSLEGAWVGKEHGELDISIKNSHKLQFEDCWNGSLDCFKTDKPDTL